MGTDNLFHRLKTKQIKELSRKNAKRDPYDKVLIVCEGKKTEPHYFNDLNDSNLILVCHTEIIDFHMLTALIPTTLKR